MRVAGCSTNTHATRACALPRMKGNSRSRHTLSPRGRKRGYYFLSYAASAVYTLRLTNFRSSHVSLTQVYVKLFTHPKKCTTTLKKFSFQKLNLTKDAFIKGL
ncbi:hypothetical protein EVAR_100392_1 [Eumeta japonica]|uniref:Uncharacterized protein n=1 Tax=Eumeta variegata TaxID=151549 RepID=A0A4C1STP4_EUMVA|nr:hypothetical protein EVAR_100392_1 [Eumeta japonica]